jgi:hypothetical protein
MRRKISRARASISASEGPREKNGVVTVLGGCLSAMDWTFAI